MLGLVLQVWCRFNKIFALYYPFPIKVRIWIYEKNLVPAQKSIFRKSDQSCCRAAAPHLDADSKDNKKEVWHVGSLLALLPVVEVQAGAEQVAEDAQHQDGHHQDAGREGKVVLQHAGSLGAYITRVGEKGEGRN